MKYNFKKNIWLQVAVWLAIYAIYFNMIYYFSSALKAFVIATYNVGCLMLIFLTIVYHIFPKYYHKRSKYFAVSFGMIVFITLVVMLGEMYYFSSHDSKSPPTFFHFMRIFTQYSLALFVATSASLMQQTALLTEREKQLSEEKFKTELKLLKAQINPHFIFNALNNIYSLTYMQNANAPDSVLKLSEMLRYVFYDCNKDKVQLHAEVKYINNFIAFQQMKSEHVQNISFDVNSNCNTIEVAPMLFIPFIENAFKYSKIEEEESAYVKIAMQYEQDTLVFRIENSIPNTAKTAPGSGMGIRNVKHRLDIIYRELYTLHIDDTNDTYCVDLKIKL